ncbi:hypothetical protein [Kineococcus glutinatus]|uniref:Uncharacterized protein n=1 Tax=Kineococcus glutinatus TaxID=1070872 RepID=A0ABP9HNG3_9ACTN
MPVGGARALLIDGSRAALIGGYGGDADVITPLQLTDEGVQLAGPPRRLVLPNGAPISPGHLSGRGAELHLAVDATWYRLHLEDIPTD